MTYTDPTWWPVATLVDAADLNTYLRDNLTHIYQTNSGPVPCTIAVWQSRTISGTLAANHTFYGRIRGPQSSISSMLFEVATSSGNVSCAVFNNTGSGRSAKPNVRQATSGAVAMPASGAASVSLGSTVVVGAGTSWFALSSTSAAAALYGAGHAPQWSNMGSGLGYREGTHPAPGTASASGTAIVSAPMLVGD